MNAPVFVMRKRSAASLSLLNIARDGRVGDIPIVTSQNIGSGIVALIDADQVFVADAGLEPDVFLDGSVQLDSAPSDSEAEEVSLFQNGLAAVRVERYMSWTRGRNGAVSYLTGCAW
jgi:hypothetical protein